MLTRKPSASAAAGAAYPAGKKRAATIAAASGARTAPAVLGRARLGRAALGRGKAAGGARPRRGCPRSCRRSGAVRVGTMIRPPPGNRARGAGGRLRVRLRHAGVRSGEFASGKGKKK